MPTLLKIILIILAIPLIIGILTILLPFLLCLLLLSLFLPSYRTFHILNMKNRMNQAGRQQAPAEDEEAVDVDCTVINTEQSAGEKPSTTPPSLNR